MRRRRIALVAAAIAVIAATPFAVAGVSALVAPPSSTPDVLVAEAPHAPDAHAGHDSPGSDGSDRSSISPPMPPETDSPIETAEPIGSGSLLAAAADAPLPTERTLGETRESVDPQAVLESAGSLGGCLTDYGDTGQCLPVVPPSQAAHVQSMVAAGEDPTAMLHPWTCDEVSRFFADGIRVRGTDVQSLDRDGDGFACTTSDRTRTEGGTE